MAVVSMFTNNRFFQTKVILLLKKRSKTKSVAIIADNINL